MKINTKKISIENIEAFVFDFDGVMTNNHVNVDQYGKESVVCSRADGLAFNVLDKLDIPSYILSTEKNQVVSARAKKLKINVISGVNDKKEALINLAEKNSFNIKKIFYVGNDINDYYVMKLCGFSACPADSHEKIKSISTVILENNGGNGVIRELLELNLGLDFIEILYNT